MAKFDPFLSLDCAGVEGVGAKGRDQILPSGNLGRKRLERINGAMISGASRIGRLSERKDAKEEAEERKEGRTNRRKQLRPQ